ncbi:MAG: N-acetyltransferase [Hyphomicrobiaceae bacterium]|nr:N-acetyltransferase [Hyphomicrobiaceae bacterium]
MSGAGDAPERQTEDAASVTVTGRIADITAADWDRLANPDPARFNPFVTHAFLSALEDAGCVGDGTGWHPRHLVLAEGHHITGVMPTYFKTHSQGEYVFDHAWADAIHRAGGRYYPKLQCAVPFTPVPGPRLMVAPGDGEEEKRTWLTAAALEVATRAGASSLHATFLDEATWRWLGQHGFLLRTGQQFHFANPGYATFDDFLSSLASRKRKMLRRERAEALSAGLTIRHATGRDITETDWDAFFAFYMDTGDRKWGRPYLNRRFFSLLGERMAERCLLILAERNGRPIAGALNLIGGDCLYGRYWGAVEHHPFLHFELCYYQAIEFAIAHGLPRVEAGAQGEHKLVRGYEPVTTYSAHKLFDPALEKAVARYLDHEREMIAEVNAELMGQTPFRKDLKAPPDET